MPIKYRRRILSRYFDKNVKLVANMCARCYEETVDVKIVGINLIFLKKATNKIKGVSILDFDFLKEEKTIERGFTKEDIEFSVTYSKQFADIVSTVECTVEKIEESSTERKSVKDFDITIFKGHTGDDINDSNANHQKTLKVLTDTRFKMYKKGGTRILEDYWVNKSRSYAKNTVKTTNKIIKELKDARDDRSKYFSISFDNNNFTVKVKEECDVKYEEKCEHTSSLGSDSGFVDYETRYFRNLDSKSLEFKQKMYIKTESDDQSIKNYFEKNAFVPPRSPHNLIEEVLYHDPWALLVATIFLNRTSCMCARPYIFWFLYDNPDPCKVLDSCPADLEKYFVNLGLHRTRATQVWRMSHDFVYKNWKSVKELYGIGKYGENAFRMFCLGDFTVEPNDRFLKIYKAWYEKVAGKGVL